MYFFAVDVCMLRAPGRRQISPQGFPSHVINSRCEAKIAHSHSLFILGALSSAVWMAESCWLLMTGVLAHSQHSMATNQHQQGKTPSSNVEKNELGESRSSSCVDGWAMGIHSCRCRCPVGARCYASPLLARPHSTALIFFCYASGEQQQEYSCRICGMQEKECTKG